MIHTYSSSCISQESYYKAVKILLDKPHVVNKRLWGKKTLFHIHCKTLSSNWNLPLDCRQIKLTSDIEEYKKLLMNELKIENVTTIGTIHDIEIILLELLPKTYSDTHAYQLIIIRKSKATITFYDVTPENDVQNLSPTFSYTLQFLNGEVILNADCDSSSKPYQWLKDLVLPQFIKWAEECVNADVFKHICTESLNLISKDKYYIRYNELKLKYGNKMVKIWPECTDPVKFVYEDIAIATYLLLLWDDSHTNNQQRFVDLGCGNGLLVYILTEEGHIGVGIDVRKRQIWDTYPARVNLEEKTIIPSNISLFQDADWIIGNHSDELTPWIPVIAARSSYYCNFFLLPCCAFNFDGTKYQRQNSSKSQYTEYLEYIRELSEDCGFEIFLDRLKIPSTKRICFVGRGRSYSKDEHNVYCNKIHNLINTDTCSAQLNNSMWVKDFKPRDPIEKVRNCTQIDKSLIESIVESISSHLLSDCNFESDWNIGKSVNLSDVVKLISQDKLNALKSECGGIQTLLKNHHHIFMVQNGKVQLRYPKCVEEVKRGLKNSPKKTLRIQQKPCWFFNNHPQGCPLSNITCSFLHKKVDKT